MELPEYYFRTRENGAFVYRVSAENRQRQLDFDHIATVNIRNGEVKAHGGRTLSAEDILAIEDWMQERISILAHRDMDDVFRLADQLNYISHWVQTKATAEQTEVITDALLLAMYDLRDLLVRKRAERLQAIAKEKQ